jgi:hypothetical protein
VLAWIPGEVSKSPHQSPTGTGPAIPACPQEGNEGSHIHFKPAMDTLEGQDISLRFNMYFVT